MVMELQEGRSLADVIDETTLPIAAIMRHHRASCSRVSRPRTRPAPSTSM